MPSDRESSAARAFAGAQDLLVRAGFHTDTTLEDLRKWFLADTAYPDLGLEQVLKNRILLVHEIVEIDEVKKMGLKIRKDTIVRHCDPVYEAHLKAAEVELEIAIGLKDYGHIKHRLGHIKHRLGHIKHRLGHIKNWCEDPLLPKRLRRRCLRLYEKAGSATRDF